MNIEINDRLYNEFVSWAQANNMNSNDIQKYIEKAFRDKFTIDKYGDLNEKIIKEEPKKTQKKIEPINEPINELIGEPVSKPDDEQEKVEKPKRKTKVIASK